VHAASPRERKVAAVDAAVPGPEARYVELEGNIGLLVGGGGAGLYQQDRIRAWGGRAANHSVTPPTGSDDRKLRATIEAILEHPNIRALLVGFNYAQMARADIRVNTLVDVIYAKGIDTSRLPIVISHFGAGEAQARARVAGRAGIHYLPRDASLDDAVRLVVELAAAQGPQAT
jgi:succinyl-CoA synthetase beta subunit